MESKKKAEKLLIKLLKKELKRDYPLNINEIETHVTLIIKDKYEKLINSLCKRTYHNNDLSIYSEYYWMEYELKIIKSYCKKCIVYVEALKLVEEDQFFRDYLYDNPHPNFIRPKDWDDEEEEENEE